jgi:hypothetical protein
MAAERLIPPLDFYSPRYLEALMQPLDTYHLVLNIFVAVVMPLLILANVMGWGARTPVNDFLWRDHTNFMRISMVIIGLLALWSMVQLAAHFGLISAGVADVAMPVLGIPFLILAVVEIWLAFRALQDYLRIRRSQA